MTIKRKQPPELKVIMTYSCSADYQHRLRKLMALLLRPPARQPANNTKDLPVQENSTDSRRDKSDA